MEPDGATSDPRSTKSSAESHPRSTASSQDHLRRPGEGRMVAGVAAGIAECFDLDPTVVRIGFVALCLLGGVAVPIYLAGWLLMPAEGAELSVGEELLAQARAS
jgi:phage shock protein PspC (stress-responsive transcriptional regulator)